MTQYVVICRKSGFGVRIQELVSKRKKSFVTEGRKNNWSIFDFVFIFVFWLFSMSWLDGYRWVSLDRLASHQPPIPPTRENDDAKKIQGEYNLGDISISARFCANFLLNQLWCARHFSKILIPIHTMQIFQKDTYLCTLLSVCSCVSKKLWHFHFVWTQFIIGALLTQPAVRTFGKYLSLVKVSPQIEKGKKNIVTTSNYQHL